MVGHAKIFSRVTSQGLWHFGHFPNLYTSVLPLGGTGLIRPPAPLEICGGLSMGRHTALQNRRHPTSETPSNRLENSLAEQGIYGNEMRMWCRLIGSWLVLGFL